MEERQGPQNHKLSMSNRSNIEITGVNDVISFDSNEIILDTESGLLLLRGEELHISHLTLEKGEAVSYTHLLSVQIQTRQMGKRYYAVLTGVLAKKEGELADTLLKDGRTNMSKIVPKGTAGGKEARLKYKVLRTKRCV